MAEGRGLYYAPSPPPQGGGEGEIRQWCEREFTRIADSLREGRSQFVRLDVLRTEPERRFAGLVAYFAASVVGPTEGLYEFRSGAWVKL